MASGSPVFLSLGSNLGHRESQLRAAVTQLAAFLDRIRVSSIYESRALYVTAQPDFLNVVLHGYTRLTPGGLLKRTRDIEDGMGRDRSAAIPKGPRVLDIDILLFGEQVISEPDLSVPHPGMLERSFVLLPLLELEPSIRDPRTGLTFARALDALSDQGIYTYAPWAYTEQAGQG